MISFIRSLFALLFGGDVCVRCGKPSGALPLCRPCLARFTHGWASFTDEAVPRCRICGKELVSEIGICSACRAAPTLKNTDGVFPLHSYRLWKKSVLFAWKMQDRRALSPIIAELYARALTQLESRVAATAGTDGTLCTTLPLVPVPPRPGKIRARGWDQIDEVCRLLRRRHHKTVLPLLRRTSLVQQKKLGRVQRLGGTNKAYVLAEEKTLRRLCPNDAPKSVILVDDVLTTGATIESCAAQLKAFGVQKVYAITLFAVD